MHECSCLVLYPTANIPQYYLIRWHPILVTSYAAQKISSLRSPSRNHRNLNDFWSSVVTWYCRYMDLISTIKATLNCQRWSKMPIRFPIWSGPCFDSEQLCSSLYGTCQPCNYESGTTPIVICYSFSHRPPPEYNKSFCSHIFDIVLTTRVLSTNAEPNASNMLSPIFSYLAALMTSSRDQSKSRS